MTDEAPCMVCDEIIRQNNPPSFSEAAVTDCPSCGGPRVVLYLFKPGTNNKHIEGFAKSGTLLEKSTSAKVLCSLCGYSEATA